MTFDINNTQSNCDTVHRHIEAIMPRVECQPTAKIPFPFLTPSYGDFYHQTIYVWDHHHMALRFASAGRPEYLRYLDTHLPAIPGKLDPARPDAVHPRTRPASTTKPTGFFLDEHGEPIKTPDR